MHIGLASLSKEESPPEPKSLGLRKWSLGAWNGQAVSAVIRIAPIVIIWPMVVMSSADTPNVEDDPLLPVFMEPVLAAGVLLMLVGIILVMFLVARAWLDWQTVILDDESFTIENSVFGRTRRMKYLRRYIGEMRVLDDVPKDAKTAKFDPDAEGVFEFRYGIQTVRFGPEMMKAEAEKKLAQILAFAPDLAEPAAMFSQVDGEQAGWSVDPDVVSPLEYRFVLEQRDDEVRITIPSKSNRWLRAFSWIWLIGWGSVVGNALPVIWVSVARLRTGLPVGDNITDLKMSIGVLSLWIILWTFWSVFVLWWLVWAKWGRQIIDINPTRIAVRNVWTLRPYRRVIDRRHGTPIHLRPDPGDPASASGNIERSPLTGWLECKSQDATHHFGAGLTRREAEYLLKQLQQIDPSLVEVQWARDDISISCD